MLFSKLNDLSIGGKGAYGIAASAVERKADLPTYLRITDIFDDGTLNLSELKSVDAPNSDKYILKPNDIVFARTGGSTGRNYFYDGSDGVFVYAGFLIKFSIDPEKVNPKYVKYYCRSKQYNDWVQSFNTGSTRGNINAQTFGNMEIPLPERKQQDYLVSILEPIDEKIKNNKQVNDNLQQQLAAIYKSWYQDFSLVNDTEFIGTEYGMIPQGWHYVLLGDLCHSISVTHKFDKSALIFLNTGDIEDGRFLHSNLMAVKDMPGQAKKTIAPGDILYSEIRPINRHFAYVNFPSDDYVVSTKLMVIRAKNFDKRRLYHYLTSENVLNELQLQAESRSGTFPQIRFENVSRLPILIADQQTESEFAKILHTVYDQIEQLNRENEQLADLRDTLLPKLMSGEIDVSDIQL